MKTTEIVGFKRATNELGTAFSKRLRAEGNVPCVLYGGEEVIHFHAPMYLFRDLLYTPDSYIVDLNVEGVEKKCILQDVQFHPVSDMILHVDFLEISEDKPVKMDVPVKITGAAEGVKIGGVLVIKTRKLRVKALPSQLPDYVEANVDGLQLGKSLKVESIKAEGYEILNAKSVSVASVTIPRSLRQALNAGDVVEGEEEEA
ncbi:MAG: 50S ribosomal protein L25/general stress protein Ctc [Cytophagales bacterium]|nr:50S ribosomal protein L25/general stress protein Ctc [Cytophagales bacterium]